MAGITLGTKLSLGQGLLMTPQLQQAIKLLQLSRLELEQFVETQLAENPVLEEQAPESSDDIQGFEREATEIQAVSDRLEAASSIVDKVSKDEKPDVDWDNLARYEESRNQASAGGQRNGDEDDIGNYENLATKANSIQEHLMQQVSESDFDETEKLIATMIVGNIDDRGYLSTPMNEICVQEKMDLELAEGVLDTIQRFDPPGVGARNLEECLLNQLK
ncbi:MAG: RNA polymerase sigma-54 factor, partial [Proteobacteria bacterium]|nr:RNA polymerase sigma-54 factor [Pseudomonadota bacterium]